MLRTKTSKKKVITRFPTRELKTWLKGRDYWNHDDWLGLIDDLRTRGFTKWTENQDGRDQIGQYLEDTRANV